MKILIENAVPLNNGDAALIFAIGNRFEEKDDEVFYSTFNSKKVRSKYPSEKWINSPLNSKISRLPFIGFIYIFLKVLLSKKYRKFDAIIAAPGGYINSYYGFKRKLQLLYMYKLLLKKKIYIYSQSIGPLNKRDEENLKRYIGRFDLIFVRDSVSKERVTKLGDFKNVLQTKDAAFLLKPISKKNVSSNKVAISVREWKHDSRNEKDYIDLIKEMIKYLVESGYEVTFLSTCQGESDYTNDAIMAQKIYNKLDRNLKIKVTIDKEYYNLSELRKKLTEYKFVVGTRLHMCILSWLSGTPAFNISYEEKGKECYKYLGLARYTMDYNSKENVVEKISPFFNLNETELQEIFSKVSDVHCESKDYFEYMYKNISF